MKHLFLSACLCLMATVASAQLTLPFDVPTPSAREFREATDYEKKEVFPLTANDLKNQKDVFAWSVGDDTYVMACERHAGQVNRTIFFVGKIEGHVVVLPYGCVVKSDIDLNKLTLRESKNLFEHAKLSGDKSCRVMFGYYKDGKKVVDKVDVHLADEKLVPPPAAPLIPEILEVVDEDVELPQEEIQTTEEVNEAVYDVPGTPAEFPNDNVYSWISKNMRYPAQCLEEGIQGRVLVQFVVGRDGSPMDIKVIRSPHPALEAEAIRLIKAMPKWKPAYNAGKPVRQRMTLPIMFRLADK